MENQVGGPHVFEPLLEPTVQVVVGWVRLGVEVVGASVVVVGVLIALVQCVRALIARQGADFNAIRLVLARYLALALEFQLGADILSTTVAPSLQQIEMLGAIAVIRTALNFFLGREMREEQELIGHEKQVHARAGGDSSAPEIAARSASTST